MTNLAIKLDTRPSLSYGWIDEMAEGKYWVATESGRRRALKAASCLLAPQPGDRVLIALDEVSSAYILAVLERADPSVSRIDLPGDATIHASGDLSLAAARELTCTAPRLSVGVEDGDFSILRTRLLGNLVEIQAERIKSVCVTADQIYRDLTQRIGDYFRATSGHEDVHAKSSRKLVEQDLTMQSRNTVIIAERNVKIDGELIHLG